MLLGLDEPEDLEKEKQKEKKKKKSLLLQAEGQRKSGKFNPVLPLALVADPFKPLTLFLLSSCLSTYLGSSKRSETCCKFR